MLVANNEIRCKKCGGNCRLTVGGVAIYFNCLESDCGYSWHEAKPITVVKENEKI
ncbi:MAG: hypothetical protein KAS32_04195 [Candidatus Peribacteraceae bacterium]|nr:hypothetical protein [Candidatus Peribacteraceae bacterium]